MSGDGEEELRRAAGARGAAAWMLGAGTAGPQGHAARRGAGSRARRCADAGVGSEARKKESRCPLHELMRCRFQLHAAGHTRGINAMPFPVHAAGP